MRGGRLRSQALVIGLGQFGLALAQSLEREGVEVIAVDRREANVNAAADHVTEALVADAMDEALLSRLAPEKRDVCVCAIGDESREASIVVTALLRQLGGRHVVARATDPLHERILSLVGAHVVVQPERIFGERLAARLAHPNLIDIIPLGSDLMLSELAVPAAFVGRTLADLELPRRFEVTVVAVRRDERRSAQLPTPELALEPGDVLVVASTSAAARKLATWA